MLSHDDLLLLPAGSWASLCGSRAVFGLFSSMGDRSGAVRMDRNAVGTTASDKAEPGSDDEGHIEVTTVCIADCRAEAPPAPQQSSP